MERDGPVPCRYMSLLSMLKHHHLLHHRVFFELNMFFFPSRGTIQNGCCPFANHSKQRGVPTPKKDKTHAQIYGSFSNQGPLAFFSSSSLFLLFLFWRNSQHRTRRCNRLNLPSRKKDRRSDSEDMKYISKLRALISEEELRRDFPEGRFFKNPVDPWIPPFFSPFFVGFSTSLLGKGVPLNSTNQ